MLSLFQIDFAVREFIWAIGLGLGLALASCRWGDPRLIRRVTALPPVIHGIALFVIMLGLQVVVAARCGWPVPALHDEFSYLLAADTFAAGRLTNPTHPAWEFLETYHVLWRPTYQSKYPPGNGLVLAAGQALTGYPITGAWMCLAGATAGIYWMLLGWLTRRWALAGALILICNWPVTRLWGQTYYGGGPALLGAVLVYGSFARLNSRPAWKLSLGFAAGLAIWAITRPYEGLVASGPVCLILLLRIMQATPSQTLRWVTQFALPVATVLGTACVLLGTYHRAVTGSPFTWPYRLYESTYTRRVGTLNTVFAFTELGDRQRTIPSLEYRTSAGTMRIAETKPILYALWKTVRQWWFHVGLLWTIPCGIACATLLRPKPDTSPKSRSRILLATGTIALVGIAVLLQRSAGLPHYAAPALPLVILLVVEGLRRIQTYRWRKTRIGYWLVCWVIWSATLFYCLPLLTGANTTNTRRWSLERARIERELVNKARPSLVIVRYGPQHSMHEEWVYNRADIDRAKVVWAHELEPSKMSRLRELFPDREVWLIAPDSGNIVLNPYQINH